LLLAAGQMATDRGPTRVVLADDECLFRTSLRELLGVPPNVIREVYGTDVGPGFELVGEASSGEETVRVVAAVRPDLLLLDLNMPRLSGLDAMREMAQASMTTRTILLTGEVSRAHVLRAVRLGVNGVVVKHAATELLFEAISAVMAGRCWLDQTVVSDLIDHTRTLLEATAAGRQEPIRLTRREHEVLCLVAEGWPNKEIAKAFGLSEQTVKHYMTRLLGKVGASNRTELAARAAARGVTRRPELTSDAFAPPVP
jgi:DNA-binding NarL/FixJ family response regulator